MNSLIIKKWAMALLLLSTPALATETEEPPKEPSTIEVLLEMLTPGGTHHGPP